jgi:GMP synthase (glutamine-hydrolysing)
VPTEKKPVLVLRHEPRCSLGSISAHLTCAGLDYRYVDLFAELPRQLPLDKAAGLVVLGGPMSANDTDKFPFLLPELDWITAAVENQTPTLGVCLGAQLLAKALGEKVYPNTRQEIGWYAIDMLPPAGDDQLFGGCQSAETVFQWHGDTFDLPAGAVHLARSELCSHQAFRYGTHAYGLQFHIEMTPELLAGWLAEPDAELRVGGRAVARTIQSEAPQRFPAMSALSGRVLTRFAEMCCQRGQAT